LLINIPIYILFSYALVVLLNKIPQWMQIAVTIIFFLFPVYSFYKYKSTYYTYEWWKQQGLKECFSDLYTLEKNNIHNIKLGMCIDHFGSYENYFRYLAPEKNPRQTMYYNRYGYDNFTISEIEQMKQQDYLLMFGDYKLFLNQHIPSSHQKHIKHYPSMQTDLIKIEKAPH
jgi:hypothetical protein